MEKQIKIINDMIDEENNLLKLANTLNELLDKRSKLTNPDEINELDKMINDIAAIINPSEDDKIDKIR